MNESLLEKLNALAIELNVDKKLVQQTFFSIRKSTNVKNHDFIINKIEEIMNIGVKK